MHRSMGQPPTLCTMVILPATLALRSVQTTSWSMAPGGTTRPISEVIGWAVHAPTDSVRASPIIGAWDLASDSVTGFGSEPGRNPGGVRTDGEDATIMITLTSV